MKLLRRILAGFLVVMALTAVMPEFITSASYDQQFRDYPDAPPSHAFLLGTDDMGRDRMARLLYGARLSLLLSSAAALVSTLLASAIGAAAGYLGGWCDRIVTRAIDLTLSLPWLFVLITARALLPLNVSPLVSVAITFGLLALVGWASPARVVRAGVRALRDSDAILQAKASGCGSARLLAVHILPQLKPVLAAQFCTAVPTFILTEANMSLLGVGVAEPLSSFGNLLRDLQNQPSLNGGLLAPLVVLIIVIGCFQVVFSVEDVHS
jgi:peptide/nickel transport system permease protein